MIVAVKTMSSQSHPSNSPEDPRYAPIKSTPANTGQYGSSPRAQNTTNLSVRSDNRCTGN